MTGKPTQAHDKAREAWKSAPEGKKPTLAEMSRKYKLDVSTLFRARRKWENELKGEKK